MQILSMSIRKISK